MLSSLVLTAVQPSVPPEICPSLVPVRIDEVPWRGHGPGSFPPLYQYGKEMLNRSHCLFRKKKTSELTSLCSDVAERLKASASVDKCGLVSMTCSSKLHVQRLASEAATF